MDENKKLKKLTGRRRLKWLLGLAINFGIAALAMSGTALWITLSNSEKPRLAVIDLPRLNLDSRAGKEADQWLMDARLNFELAFGKFNDSLKGMNQIDRNLNLRAARAAVNKRIEELQASMSQRLEQIQHDALMKVVRRYDAVLTPKQAIFFDRRCDITQQVLTLMEKTGLQLPPPEPPVFHRLPPRVLSADVAPNVISAVGSAVKPKNQKLPFKIPNQKIPLSGNVSHPLQQSPGASSAVMVKPAAKPAVQQVQKK